MDAAPQHMPSAVLAVAIPVFIFSLICLCFGLTLTTVVWKTRDGYSYVLLFAMSLTGTCVTSIVQQLNYMANWHELRVEQYDQSFVIKGNPALAMGPLSKGFNAALFWVSIYFYNVDSLIFVFWAMALVISVWNLRYKWIQLYGETIGLISKIVAVILPAVFSGLRKGFAVNSGFVGTLILMNVLMIGSIAIGAICLILILVRYLNARLGLFSYGTGTGSNQKSSGVGDTLATEDATTAPKTKAHRPRPSGLKARVDTMLVIRFSIAFLVLSGFEIFLIEFEVGRYRKSLKANTPTEPDFSNRASIIDILNYLPGVTASLLAFLLFGLTAQQRAMYPGMLRSLNPLTLRKRVSQRFSGQQWRRMDSQDPARARAEDIEMQASGVKKTVTMQVTSVDGDSDDASDGGSPLPTGRVSISRQFPGQHSWNTPGILEGCEENTQKTGR